MSKEMPITEVYYQLQHYNERLKKWKLCSYASGKHTLEYCQKTKKSLDNPLFSFNVRIVKVTVAHELV
jgi:hypothetical protein